jgi:hypothetical protein
MIALTVITISFASAVLKDLNFKIENKIYCVTLVGLSNYFFLLIELHPRAQETIVVNYV